MLVSSSLTKKLYQSNLLIVLRSSSRKVWAFCAAEEPLGSEAWRISAQRRSEYFTDRGISAFCHKNSRTWEVLLWFDKSGDRHPGSQEDEKRGKLDLDGVQRFQPPENPLGNAPRRIGRCDGPFDKLTQFAKSPAVISQHGELRGGEKLRNHGDRGFR